MAVPPLDDTKTYPHMAHWFDPVLLLKLLNDRRRPAHARHVQTDGERTIPVIVKRARCANVGRGA